MQGFMEGPSWGPCLRGTGREGELLAVVVPFGGGGGTRAQLTNHQLLPLGSGKEALEGQGRSWGHRQSLRGWGVGPLPPRGSVRALYTVSKETPVPLY